jgi:hypothetical protein
MWLHNVYCMCILTLCIRLKCEISVDLALKNHRSMLSYLILSKKSASWHSVSTICIYKKYNQPIWSTKKTDVKSHSNESDQWLSFSSSIRSKCVLPRHFLCSRNSALRSSTASERSLWGNVLQRAGGRRTQSVTSVHTSSREMIKHRWQLDR